MPNSVNCRPFVPYINTVGDTLGYADNLGPNFKYSSGFHKRRDLLFNTLEASPDNGTETITGKSCKMTLLIPLHHLFYFFKINIKVFVAGTWEIKLTTNATLERVLIVDRTPQPVKATSQQSAITYPINPTNYDWSFAVKNMRSPFKALDDVTDATGYLLNRFKMNFLVTELFTPVVVPRLKIMADIYEEYMPEASGEVERPVFNNTLGVYENMIQITDNSRIQLPSSLSKAEFLIFAFMPENGTCVVNNATGAGTGGKYISVAPGLSVPDGSSNYSVFDPLGLESSRLYMNGKQYPESAMLTTD
jgi:hypothetical protein